MKLNIKITKIYSVYLKEYYLCKINNNQKLKTWQ